MYDEMEEEPYVCKAEMEYLMPAELEKLIEDTVQGGQKIYKHDYDERSQSFSLRTNEVDTFLFKLKNMLNDPLSFKMPDLYYKEENELDSKAEFIEMKSKSDHALADEEVRYIAGLPYERLQFNCFSCSRNNRVITEEQARIYHEYSQYEKIREYSQLMITFFEKQREFREKEAKTKIKDNKG